MLAWVDYLKVSDGSYDYFFKDMVTLHNRTGTITTKTKEITEDTYYKNLERKDEFNVETRFKEISFKDADPYIKNKIRGGV